MGANHPEDSLQPSAQTDRELLELSRQFAAVWQSPGEPGIANFLNRVPADQQSKLFRLLVRQEWTHRCRLGQTPEIAEYRARFQRYTGELDQLFGEWLATTPPLEASQISTTEPLVASAPVILGRSLGRFQLEKLLGRGGFGAVYLARDPQLDRHIALKVPRTGTFDDPEDAAYFFREAKAAAQLRHPNIVPVHDAGQASGLCFIASEYIPGRTLRSELKPQTPWEPSDAARLVAKLADALHYAHCRGIVHRDVKPENIMLADGGEPHIMDFGLARRDGDQSLRTLEGTQLGTPAYMSPEQVRGKSHLADARSDLWALGVMFYELLTGQRPFRGNSGELFHEICELEPPPPSRIAPRIPRDLDTIVLKCLSKQPQHRYTSCQELSDELGRWLRGEPILSRPLSAPERLQRWVRRNPVVSALVGAVAISLLLGSVTSFVLWHQAVGQSKLAKTNASTANRNASRAKDETLRANRERDAAMLRNRKLKARQLGLEATQLTNDYPQRALLLAAEACELTHRVGEPIEPQVEQALRDLLATVGGRPLLGTTGPVVRLAFQPQSGLLIATSGPNILAWKIKRDGDLQPFWQRSRQEFGIELYTLSADGCWLAGATKEGELVLWDLRHLPKLMEPLRFQDDGGVVSRLTIESQGRRTAFIQDAKLKIWNPEREGQPTATGPWDIPDPKAVLELRFSGDGRRLLILDGTKRVLLYDVPTEGIEIAPPKVWVQANLATHVDINAQGDRFFVGEVIRDKFGTKQEVRYSMWDAANPLAEQPLRVFAGNEGMADVVHVSPSSRWLVANANDQIFRLWPLNATDFTASPLDLSGHEGISRLAIFSPDESQLITASDSPQPVLWNLKAAQPADSGRRLYGHEKANAGMLSAAASSDGNWLATADFAGHARLWNLRGHTTTHPWVIAKSTIIARRAAFAPTYWAISPDRRWLFSYDRDGAVIRIDITSTTKEPVLSYLHGHTARVQDIVVTPDSRWLVTTGQDNTVRMWDLSASDPAASARVFQGQYGFRLVRISPNGRYLYAAGYVKKAYFWDLQSGNFPANAISLEGFESNFDTANFSADSRWLAAGYSNRQVKLWDLHKPVTLESASTLEGHQSPVKEVLFSQDSLRLITRGRAEKQLLVWDLAASPVAGSSRAVETGSMDWSSLSPDGRWLAGKAANNRVGVFDLNSPGVPIQASPILDQYQLQGEMLFSEDGRWLVGSAADSVYVWNVADGNLTAPPRVFHGGTRGVERFCFSPSGRWLAACDRPGNVYVWDLLDPNTTGTPVVLRSRGSLLKSPEEEQTQARLPPEQIWKLGFSPDSRWLLGHRDDESLNLWPMEIESLFALARQVAGRELTLKEREIHNLEIQPVSPASPISQN